MRFRCNQCHKEFDEEEIDLEHTRCPDCSSYDLEHLDEISEIDENYGKKSWGR